MNRKKRQILVDFLVLIWRWFLLYPLSSVQATFALPLPSTKRSRSRCYDYSASFLVRKEQTGWRRRKRLLARYIRNDDDDNDEDDEDDFDNDMDIANFKPSTISFGIGRGRSAPSQRKAMGTSGSGSTSVYVCTNCGSEFVKWMGRCPTCREWNTLQEFQVDRGEQQHGIKGNRPKFGSSSRPTSWLNTKTSMNDFENQPIRVTDVYREVNQQEQGKKSGGGSYSYKSRRVLIPNDDELNTVLGGGLMTGSLTLLGGDPGVGKSTLLLQTAGSLAELSTPSPGIGMGLPATKTGNDEQQQQHQQLGPVWYVSGEENAQQIASRAARLGIDSPELWLLTETYADALAEQVVASYHSQGMPKTTRRDSTSDCEEDEVIPGQVQLPPALLVVDSIQTMVCEAGGASAAGGVTQVRECVALFLRLAKSTGIPIILVGHVTKSGDVAGPRTVEHMVDCVLYLEGGNSRTIGGVNLRMLRAAKNRFGSSSEVGVYEMTTGRLRPVSDPSSLFLSNRLDAEDPEGCAVALALEGLRAMTVEIQALSTPVVSADGKGYGRRTVDGIAYARLLLLLGVLQKRCGLFLGKQDIYINVVGHMRLDQNTNEGHASDLAVSVALVSSFLAIPVRGDTAFVAEVGLLGELRTVPALEKRIQEAERMGFSRVVTPIVLEKGARGKSVSMSERKTIFKRYKGIDWIQCATLHNAINEGLIRDMPKRARKRRTDKHGESSSNVAPGTIQDLMLGEAFVDSNDDSDYDDGDFQ